MPRNGESGTVSDSENLSVTPGDHGKGMAGLIFKLATKIEEDIRGFSLICPLNIGIGMTPAYVEAIVVNASEEGFLIESPRDIPVGTELSMTVLYPKGFELANFKVTAKIVWKEPYWLCHFLCCRKSPLSIILPHGFSITYYFPNHESKKKIHVPLSKTEGRVRNGPGLSCLFPMAIINS